ncbi:hypothetical protein like AT3G48440 [Hibiscus trionum]|uniref:C3H1-type domain-containing protein n=1 Tax=Hibiscus trionum TaxID=183268 RepID=A0A9W7J155_HIBTR|nr:hypothetical protein like AT3G48440 [Hibiscus trionum]
MSLSEETLDSDTTPNESAFHLGLQSPNPDLSPHDLNHSAVETEHEESNLEQQLENLDFAEEAEGEEKERYEEAEKKDHGGRESDNDADGNASADEDDEGGEERNGDEIDGENVKKNERKRSHYPVRPEAEDCAYYMKTGLCKFGYNCKFNHPLRRKNQDVKEKVKENDESTEKPSQAECKFYLRTGGCKFGKACRYNHSPAKSSVGPILELNFLGLPIRPGEKECPYYMRNGSCKYGLNCRFNHPNPTTTGACDPPSGYGNGGSVSSQAAPRVNTVPWSSPRALNETAAYMPVMFSPPQVVPPPNLEWNGYQTTVYCPLERSLDATPVYVMNNPLPETAVYTHNQPQTLADEFPARPGQPECTFFLKTGDSTREFH